MVYNAFKARKTDEMKAVLSINSTNLIMMPPDCTSKCQSLNVCINKPFNGVLRNCWEDYVADIVTNISEEDIGPEMIEESFSVCGIATQKKNATKIHSATCNLVACILFSRTSVYYDNINSLFSPPYLISYLTTIFL